MKIALVHDWLTSMRGGERCLEVICDIFRDADIFTLLHFAGNVSEGIERHRIIPSAINWFPGVRRFYRHYLPVYPWAISRFDLSGYDAILSVSHCAAKGVKVPAGVPHICYCLTPARYLYDRYEDYFAAGRGMTLPVRLAMRLVREPLRKWDVENSHRVSTFLAISKYVAERVRRCYATDAKVIYPPVGCERFTVTREIEDHYLVVSALVPYKRIDLAINTFNALGKKLYVVGTGPEEKHLNKIAGNTIRFFGWLSNERLARLYAKSLALVVPGEEDFGIAAVEAQASGRPVIGFGKGGLLETVIPLEGSKDSKEPTGVFFYEQTPEALAEAVLKFERERTYFDPEGIRCHSLQFDEKIFRQTGENDT